MKKIVFILLSFGLAGEMEVDGNLKVTGTIQNDSLAQVIANLQAQITALQNQVIQFECINNGVIPEGYCNCSWNVLDACGDCGGDAISENECNSALSFDGVDDYVDFGDILNDLYQPVTFQISAKFNGNGGTLFSTDNCGVENCNYNGYWLSISTTLITISYGDGEWHGGGERRTGKANVDLSAGEWYSIATIVSGPQDMRIYLDGTSLDMNYQDGGTGGTVNFTTDPFRVGKQDNGYFNGLLDELRVWDIELDANQIQSNYNSELTGNESGLVGYWNFNLGTGSTLYDHSGNENHGTIHGATWVQQ